MLKNFLLLTAFSTFVVIVIVGLDVFHKYQVSTLKENTQKRVLPISPNFDNDTLEGLKKRIPISVSLEGKSSVVSEDTSSGGTPTPTPSSALTPTGSLLQQQVTASGSGQ